MNVAHTIRMYRERLGLNQSQMAEKLNMTTTGYGKIERSEVGVNQQRLEAIAKVFGISLKDLISDEDISLSKQTEIEFLQKILFEKDKRIEGLEREIMYLKKIAQI